jgi:hypothetical protein
MLNVKDDLLETLDFLEASSSALRQEIRMISAMYEVQRFGRAELASREDAGSQGRANKSRTISKEAIMSVSMDGDGQ